MTATEVFLPQLRDGGGDLINISSVAGRTSPVGTLPAVDAYTVVLELAIAADADHAGQHLDDLANYHPAITRTHSGRAELILSPSPHLWSRSVPVDTRPRARERPAPRGA